ncbi:MAG: hypothetical protein ACRC62_09375 [Microcoleus sp.]
MTQQNLRELLKQGDPKAIASSINRTLKPKGISAEVTRDNGNLHITLESAKVPNQMALVDFIRTGMTNLGVESIHTVKVYGRRTGDASPAWEDEIDLMPPEPMLYADEGPMPDDSVGLDDVEPEGEDYYDDEEFEDRDGEDPEFDDETREAPPPKKQFPKWVIPVGILVPVAAIAGLYFTGNLPFASSSTSETEEVPAATSSPASGTSKTASPSPAAKQTASPSAPATAAPNAAKPASPTAGASPTPKPVAPKSDPWRDAVNSAQKAAILAQTAQSQSEWNVVASEWKKAVDLMRAVPAASPNYQKAQQKAAEYQLNLGAANRRAAAAP